MTRCEAKAAGLQCPRRADWSVTLGQTSVAVPACGGHVIDVLDYFRAERDVRTFTVVSVER